MYGRFKSRPTEEEEKAAKLARLSKMKKIYLPPRISPSKRLHFLSLIEKPAREISPFYLDYS